MRWSGVPVSKNCPQFVLVSFPTVSEAEAVFFFLEFPSFVYDPVGGLIGFFCLFKVQLVHLEVLGV